MVVLYVMQHCRALLQQHLGGRNGGMEEDQLVP